MGVKNVGVKSEREWERKVKSLKCVCVCVRSAGGRVE